MPEAATEKNNSEAKKSFIEKIDGTKFALEHPELWKFTKALCTGFIGSIPEMVSYLLLCSWFSKLAVTYLPSFFFFDLIIRGMDATQYEPAVQVYAFLISTAVGQFVGFVLARKIAFHANANVALSTFLKVIIVIFTIGMCGIIGPAIVTGVARIPYLNEYPSLVQIVSKVATMASTTAWVYPSDRFIVHRQVKKEPPVLEEKTNA